MKQLSKIIYSSLENYSGSSDATDLKWNNNATGPKLNKLSLPNKIYQPSKNIKITTAWEKNRKK